MSPAAAPEKPPGCSKCRFANRGCRRCVDDFVPASAVRAAKHAEKAFAAEKAAKSAAPLVQRDPNLPRPRGRPRKIPAAAAATTPTAGLKPKTPVMISKSSAAAAAAASPPSPAVAASASNAVVNDLARAAAPPPTTAVVGAVQVESQLTHT